MNAVSTRTKLLTSLLTVMLLAGLVACGHTAKLAGSAGSLAVPAAAPAAGAGAAAGAAATGTTFQAPAPLSGGKASPPGNASKLGLQQRDLVRTATVNVETKDVDKSADAIILAIHAAGGRVDQDNRSTADKKRSATMVLRVPPDRLDAAIATVDKLGTETGRAVAAADVTSSHADINARVLALTTSQTRLRQLLSQSGSVGSLLQVESQLTQREADLQSTVAQQRALGDQISLATLTVKLSLPVAGAPVVATKGKLAGFTGALAGGWHGLTLAVRVVLAGFGYALPFLIVLIVAGVSWLAIRRRLRGLRGRAQNPAPVPQQ